MEKAIIANNITKKYKLYNGTKERLLDLMSPKNYGEDFYALTDINFEAEKGDIIGFIGVNGSGKSTLSNIIAGIVPETTGNVEVNGQAALIAVASGLKADLSGRDNIELKCLMLGFSKDEISVLEPKIIEFAELEKFIDQPVKSYSSGMKSRLGFAISVNVDPDILIIDEALSVGDKAFAEKSLNKMQEFKEYGKTMIFVSHSIGQMKQFCEKILWLEYGMVKEYGAVDEVIPRYEEFLSQWKKMSRKERGAYKKNVLEGSTPNVLNENGTSTDYEPVSESNTYQEEVTSLLGHIKGGESYIYVKPNELKDEKSSEEYKDIVYYIKRQATFRDELFYLLSNRPSAKDEVVGWMKAANVAAHKDVAIDNDTKTFYLKGNGAGFSRPWGGIKNKLLEDLEAFEDTEFKVNKTVKVGKNIWYRGILNDNQIWVHQNFVKN